MDRSPQGAMIRAMAVARVRALRLALLSLHKALIDVERRGYERVHGRLEHPHAALRVVLEDPWFQWLTPLAAAIVGMDERLADEAPLERAEADAFAERIKGLLQREDGDPLFRSQYRRVLQEAPEVVVAHGRVVKLLTDDPPVALRE